MSSFHLHLVSDATGETVNTLAKAALVLFDVVAVNQHAWTLVRNEAQLQGAIRGIAEEPGLVVFTLVNRSLRDTLEAACRDLQVPCVAVLDPVVSAMASYFGAVSSDKPGRQRAMNAAYFGRIDAMDFCLAHDDGQRTADLENADVVVVGASRTPKTPTCLYLANRGIKAANVPVVPGIAPPAALVTLDGPMIVGLTTTADRLLQVRRARLLALRQEAGTEYVDALAVREELAAARKLFERCGWPVIDVSRKAIEETAAAILSLYAERDAA
jgi:regulator of PEP synthase PpsR (kinase-PPPase family)